MHIVIDNKGGTMFQLLSISSTKTDTHNLNTINAFAAPRDDLSPATIHTATPENRQWCML